jgi:metal-responsive CopG/Arc/MetJ family transcriptional regulator
LALKLQPTETAEEKVVVRVDVSLDTEIEEKVDVASASETEEKRLEVVIALIVAAVLATAKKEEAVSEIAVADLVTARKELGILLPVQSVRAKRT